MAIERENFNQEIKIHVLGLNRLSAFNPSFKQENTLRLSKEIVNLCRKSDLPYQEIQKAIVFADNSLYFNSNV
ncbi:MAG TPA: hypothetical protein K8W06_04635 [Limosilactobacillus coleohominis]|nr:hypothetical protein [Limosilactobacillus coleohominis]